MKKLLAVVLMPWMLAACGDPPERNYLVERMTESTVCSTSNLIVKNRLEAAYGGSYRSAHIDCSARALGGNRVEISGGYEPRGAGNNPGLSARNYVARGVVNGSSLRLEEIRVRGVDDDFMPIHQFP